MTSGIDHHGDGSAKFKLDTQPKLAITDDVDVSKESSSTTKTTSLNNNDFSRSLLGNDDSQDDTSMLFDLTLSETIFHLPKYMKETAGSYGPTEYPPLSSWLLPHQTWTTITNQVYQHDRDNAQKKPQHQDEELKILYLVRHGEGEHNAAEAKYGTKYWDEVISKTMKYFDPSLTDKGVEQCEYERSGIKEQMNVYGMPLDTIVLSPLKRTIETGLIVFQDVIDTGKAARHLKKKNNRKNVPMISDEYCRETMGIHTCDERHNVTYLQSTYPNIDFSMIETNDDTWWSSTYRETSSEIDERASIFLHRLFSRDYAASTTAVGGEGVGKFVAVASHSGFIQACVRALGGGIYYPENAEIVPLAVLRKKKDVVASLGVFGRSGGGEADDSFTLASYTSVICFMLVTSLVIIRYGYHIAEIWNEKPENPCRRRQRQREYLNVLELQEGDGGEGGEEQRKHANTASF